MNAVSSLGGGCEEHILVHFGASRSAAAGCSDVSVRARGVRGEVPWTVPEYNFSASNTRSACPFQGIKGTYTGAFPRLNIDGIAAAAPAAAAAG